MPAERTSPKKVVQLAESGSSRLQFQYDPDQPIRTKIAAIARQVYGAEGVEYEIPQAEKQMGRI